MLEVLYVQLMEEKLPFDGAEQQKVYGHHGNYGPHLKKSARTKLQGIW
jgi:hypothetical protein